MTEILNSNRIGHKSSVLLPGKNLPGLEKIPKSLGKYAVIVFEDYNSYLLMNKSNRETLDKYCVTYNVGIIGKPKLYFKMSPLDGNHQKVS